MDREEHRYNLAGRGVAGNVAGRFERLRVDAVDDGWDPDQGPLPVMRTQVSEEVARSAISYNRSPDLPFDRSINPYRGCEHGCAEVLRRELAAKRYQVAPIAIGTNTDPYQPIEKQHQITRQLLEVLSEVNHPVAIVTKGSLIERDIDILSDMARRGLVRVGISVTTLDAKLGRLMEPRAPAPKRRLQMITRLAEAGIPVRVMASPMIPALTDPELEAILEAGRDAGARSASWIMLRLPYEVSELMQDWLARHYPDRANRIMTRLREMHGGKAYDAHWHTRMRGSGPYADIIAQRFDLAVKRLGLSTLSPPMRCDLFRPPKRASAQLDLF